MSAACAASGFTSGQTTEENLADWPLVPWDYESLGLREVPKNTSVSPSFQWFMEAPCKPLTLQSLCLSAVLNWLPKEGQAVALQFIHRERN